MKHIYVWYFKTVQFQKKKNKVVMIEYTVHQWDHHEANMKPFF